MMLLHQAGVKILAITTAKNASVQQFERAAGYVELAAGIYDKRAYVQKAFVDSGEYQWDEIAFIGDDLNDLELLQSVGVPGCPADAIEDVRRCVDSHCDGLVTALGGGKGAVREFSEAILSILGVMPEWHPNQAKRV
jgi:3-deoxy-D-manno-octulosonate 8-phosphate phosphatase (KDO 8-P phosphatase)